MYTALNTSDERLQSLESRCDSLVNDAVAVFADDKNRRQLQFTTESADHAIAAVLYVTDELAGADLSAAERESKLTAAASKVQTTADQIQILIQRHARFSYLCGVLVGQTQGQVPTASIGFFAVVGFIAGFSDRLATDMLERAGRLLVPVGPDSGRG